MKHHAYRFFVLLISFILVSCRDEQHVPRQATPAPASHSTLKGTIVFQANWDGDWEIYAIQADGSQLVQLTQNIDVDASPAWSPDGRQITFTSNRDGNFDVYVMQADGSRQHNLTQHPAVDEVPVWSPDGEHMAFQSDRDRKSDRTGEMDIYTMLKDGSRVQKITEISARNILPAWSPQGNWLAYTSNRGLGWHIYLHQLDNSQEEVRIARGCRPAWSPDGQYLVHVSDRGNNNNDLRLLQLNGKKVRFLTSDPKTSELDPAWSPDGRFIVYARTDEMNRHRWNIYILSLDGRQHYQLTNEDGQALAPDWIW